MDIEHQCLYLKQNDLLHWLYRLILRLTLEVSAAIWRSTTNEKHVPSQGVLRDVKSEQKEMEEMETAELDGLPF